MAFTRRAGDWEEFESDPGPTPRPAPEASPYPNANANANANPNPNPNPIPNANPLTDPGLSEAAEALGSRAALYELSRLDWT